MLIQRNLALCGLLLLASILLPTAVFAQTAPAEGVSINNAHIGFTLYRSGENESGCFEIWNVAGDPSTPRDDNELIVDWGGVQIMVDGISDEGEDAAIQWATFPKGGNLGIWGDSEDGFWSKIPEVVPGERCIKAAWVPVPDQSVLVECEQEVRLFHDMVRFKWTLTNHDLIPHQIGLKIFGCPTVEPEDGGVLDQDNVVSVPGFPMIEQRSLFPGTYMPVYADTRLCPQMEVFNSQRDPTRSARAVFDGYGATRPDVIGIDEFYYLASTGWGYVGQGSELIWWYEPPVGELITDNVAYAAFWKPVTVAPGQSRTIVHYVGGASRSHSLNIPSIAYPKYAAAVHGPRTLKYYMDPTQPLQPETYGPGVFTVTASLENHDKQVDLTNCSFTLNLPKGLVLDASETQFTKTVSRIAPNGDASVSWRVRADQTATGVLTYHVAVSAYPMGSTIVKRDIHVPAVSKQSFVSGWQQVSVPFVLTNANPTNANPASDLGLTNSLVKITKQGSAYENRYPILRYDPTLPQVSSNRLWPYEEVTVMRPGEAYWMWLTRPDTTTMPVGNYAAMQWDGTSTHTIPVRAGWNMIGNPYVYTVTAGELGFYVESMGSISYDEALKQRLVSQTVWWWNTQFNTWNWSTQRTTPIKPWQGYWIKVLDPRVQAVMISPRSQIGASVGGTPPPGDGGIPLPPGP